MSWVSNYLKCNFILNARFLKNSTQRNIDSRLACVLYIREKPCKNTHNSQDFKNIYAMRNIHLHHNMQSLFPGY